MKTPEPITIIGGGLAGLSLGLALRQEAIPVTLIEAGRYPRHRVCGEFLSGPGQDFLERLGILPLCFDAGAQLARTAAFATASRMGSIHPLPRPALCLSRHAFDHLLATELRRQGGDVRTNERGSTKGHRDGVILATGRRPSAQIAGWRWFGVKAHARNVTLVADLELHVARGAYVGLCRLGAGRVNVCGLFRRRVAEVAETRLSPLDWLRGTPGTLLHEGLVAADFDPESVCSVAGLDLRPRRAGSAADFRVGDAVTMIPPFTGNGMSMALESAALATEPIVRYARGQVNWQAARTAYGKAFDATFAARLRWSDWLQRLLFLPVIPAALLHLATGRNVLWRRLFSVTRGG